MAIITGTDGNDRYNDPTYPGNVELKGTNLADQMYGLAGNDELVGFDGDDLLEGGVRRRRAVGRLRARPRQLQGLAGGRDGLAVLPLRLQRPRRRRHGRHPPRDRGRDRLGLRRTPWYGNEQRNVFRGEGGADSLYGLAATTGSRAAAATTS